MAAKHFVPFLLLLIFYLVPHMGLGARYRIHDLTHFHYNHPQESVHNMNSFDYAMFGSSLPKAMPIPPSGPSRRHNEDLDKDGDAHHKGSSKAGEKVL